MNMQQPNPQFSGPPSNIEQRPQGQEPGGRGASGKGGFAGGLPLGFTAGGGLLVGIVAGLLLISGGGDAPEAVAAVDDSPAEIKPASTYGDLLDDDAEPDPTEPSGTDPTASDPASTDPTADPAAVDPAAVDPAAGAASPPDPASTDPDPGTAAEPIYPAPQPVVPVPTPEPPAPEPIDVRLDFDVSGLAEDVTATITLDDDVVTGTSTAFQIAAGKSKQKAKLIVRAKGYRVFRRNLTIAADMTVKVEMRKKAAGGTGRKPGGSGPGGLLDL